MDAATLLKQDHRHVEDLLEKYRSAATDSKQALLADITRELTRHMEAEEAVLYPILRSSIPGGESLMEDAADEHKEAKGLLAELEEMEAGTLTMDAKVATLRKAIEHHVQEEEGEVFPLMNKSLSHSRLEALGKEIENAKRAAHDHPPRSAAKDSPGSSVAGVVTATTDRMTK
jgi:hemerythrin-like domain-containing protein